MLGKEELNDLYWGKGLNTVEISKMIGKDSKTVWSWMKKHDIPTRTISESLKLSLSKHRKFKLSREELVDLYWNKKLSLAKIAKAVGVNETTVLSSMEKYDIPRRTASERSRKFKLSKEELNDLYRNKGLSTAEISKIAGVKHGRTVAEWMRRFGIPKRARPDRRILSWAKQFGVRRVNLEPTKELSYLIGAIWGDGSLLKQKWRLRFGSKDKDFVDEFVKCLSKILEREHPINAIFRGGMWLVGVSNREIYIFLKDKNKCGQVIERFPSDFLRGIFDAEGCVENRRYRVRMGNTDPNLIEFVKKSLDKLSIAHAIRCREAVGHRKQFFTVDLSNAKSVLKFSQHVGSSIERKQRRLAEKVQNFVKPPTPKCRGVSMWKQ